MKLLQTKAEGISSFSLKLAAIIGMTCNHIANIFSMQLIEPISIILYALGGTTFPIMAYLLTEGYSHTSNVRRYALRLGTFAVVAQIPYSLLWGACGNVLITLLLGLVLLYANDHIPSRPLFWAALAVVVLASAPLDWGVVGPLMVFLFHQLKERGSLGIFLTLLTPAASVGFQCVSNVALYASGLSESNWIAAANTIMEAGCLTTAWGEAGYVLIGFTLAGILLSHYNGTRGPSLKWFFYAYYPLHLLVLWFLKMSLV